MTIGLAFEKHIFEVENEKFTLVFWDTSGQERYRALSKGYFRDLDACIYVYDVTRPESLRDIDFWDK